MTRSRLRAETLTDTACLLNLPPPKRRATAGPMACRHGHDVYDAIGYHIDGRVSIPCLMEIHRVFGLRLRLRSPFSSRLKKISFNGDGAGIDAGSSHKKRLAYPVSISKYRYELRQQQPFYRFYTLGRSPMTIRALNRTWYRATFAVRPNPIY